MKILDYSFRKNNLVIVYSINAPIDEPNTFTFNPTEGDVIDAAIDLKIIKEPWDYDNGQNGQELRYGLQIGEDKPVYFNYPTIVYDISGEDRESIAVHLSEKEETRRQKQIEAELLNQLI